MFAKRKFLNQRVWRLIFPQFACDFALRRLPEMTRGQDELRES